MVHVLVKMSALCRYQSNVEFNRMTAYVTFRHSYKQVNNRNMIQTFYSRLLESKSNDNI